MQTRFASTLFFLCLSLNPFAAQADAGGTDFAPVKHELYAKECSGCHMAYPPGALPERSWRKLMAGLDQHFGENAELSATDRDSITQYLAQNAADHSHFRRSVKLLNAIASNQTPLRITELPYFVKEHREVAAKIKGNNKVKSLSQCDSCHTKANTGSFAEHEIEVPGIGRWD